MAIGICIMAIIIGVLLRMSGAIGNLPFFLAIVFIAIFLLVYFIPTVTPASKSLLSAIAVFCVVVALFLPVAGKLLVGASPKLFGSKGAFPLVKSRVEKRVLGAVRPSSSLPTIMAVPPSGTCVPEKDDVEQTIERLRIQEEWRSQNPNPPAADLRSYEQNVAQIRSHLVIVQAKFDRCAKVECRAQRANHIAPVEQLEARLVQYWNQNGRQMQRDPNSAARIAEFQDWQQDAAERRELVETEYRVCVGEAPVAPTATAVTSPTVSASVAKTSGGDHWIIWLEFGLFCGVVLASIQKLVRTRAMIIAAMIIVPLGWILFADGGPVLAAATGKALALLPNPMAKLAKQYMPAVLIGLGTCLAMVVMSFSKVGRMIVTPVIVIGVMLGVALFFVWLTHGGWASLTSLVS